jgi:hypothetical protein
LRKTHQQNHSMRKNITTMNHNSTISLIHSTKKDWLMKTLTQKKSLSTNIIKKSDNLHYYTTSYTIYIIDIFM